MRKNSPTVGRQVGTAALLLGVVALIAFLGSLATIPNTEGWYQDVSKVAWSPPNAVFGPAWSTLYVMIAAAGFFIWRSGYTGPGRPNRAAHQLRLYAAQLILNGLWTPIFFAGYPVVGEAAWWLALLVIATLIVTVIWLIVAAWQHSKLAAWLLVPYLLWLIFASSLNIGIIALN